MARNPIVESPKFGGNLLTFTVRIKIYRDIVQKIEGLYTLNQYCVRIIPSENLE